MLVEVTVEYTELLPTELRGRYTALPKVETFKTHFASNNIKHLDYCWKLRVVRMLMEANIQVNELKLLKVEKYAD